MYSTSCIMNCYIDLYTLIKTERYIVTDNFLYSFSILKKYIVIVYKFNFAKSYDSI